MRVEWRVHAWPSLMRLFIPSLFLLGSTPAFAEGYVNMAAGPSYGRYRGTTVHEEFDSGGLLTTFTKHKSGSAVGAALALHAGYRIHALQLGAAVRFAHYSMQLPNVSINESVDGSGSIVAEQPYQTSIATTAIGPAIGYEHRGWFARAELGIGQLSLGEQPCLCFRRADFGDVVTAGVEVGRHHYFNRDWAVTPVVMLNGTWAKVFEEIDLLDDFHTRARVTELAVMASLVYRPR